MKQTIAILAIFLLASVALAEQPTSQPSASREVGEKVPSEDPIIKDLHSLGLVNGHVNIFRCACPVRDIGKATATTQPSEQQLAEAQSRMQHLYDLGIRTVISFQNPSKTGDEGSVRETQAAVAIEKSAAEKVGLTYIAFPINNGGPDSLATMSDEQVMHLCDAVTTEIFKDADRGGVIFHCSAGHDRAGLIAAYIRIKYEHWPIEQAIAEMRRYGHNWVRYSHNGGVSSWHEEHLRAIAAMLDEDSPRQ
jgi:hypothetical protein